MATDPLNPYQPSVDVEAEPEVSGPDPRVKLHGTTSVLIATFLGSVVAGCLLLAMNFWRLGRTGPAIVMAASGFLGLGGMLLLAYVLPPEIPQLLHLLLQMVVMGLVSQTVWSRLLRDLPEKQVAYASKWWGAGVGLAACVPVAGILLTFMAVETYSLGRPVIVAGNNECYISGGATEDDARFLGQFLLAAEFLKTDSSAVLMLSKSGSRYVVSLVLERSSIDELDTTTWAKELGGQLADARFGRPLVLRLLDEDLYERQRLAIE